MTSTQRVSLTLTMATTAMQQLHEDLWFVKMVSNNLTFTAEKWDFQKIISLEFLEENF